MVLGDELGTKPSCVSFHFFLVLSSWSVLQLAEFLFTFRSM